MGNYGYDLGGWRVDRHPRLLAEVNDDGKADVIGFGNAATYVSLSTGGGFQNPQLGDRERQCQPSHGTRAGRSGSR